MINGKFAPQTRLKEIEQFECATYKEFFEYYMSHNDKGIIFGVEEVSEE